MSARISTTVLQVFRQSIVLASICATAAHAQAVQPWPDLLVSAALTNGMLVSGEAIGRIADDRRPSQIETRAQIGRALGKSITAWVGWVHFENYNPGAATGHENQVVEQVNWTVATLGRVRMTTRTRVEQRFLPAVDGTSWRWRQQLRAAVRLGSTPGLAAILWVEPFVALNGTTGQRRTLDQLRAFAGLAMPLSRKVDLEFGYLNQRVYRPDSTLVSHAIPIILTVHP